MSRRRYLLSKRNRCSGSRKPKVAEREHNIVPQNAFDIIDPPYEWPSLGSAEWKATTTNANTNAANANTTAARDTHTNNIYATHDVPNIKSEMTQMLSSMESLVNGPLIQRIKEVLDDRNDTLQKPQGWFDLTDISGSRDDAVVLTSIMVAFMVQSVMRFFV